MGGLARLAGWVLAGLLGLQLPDAAADRILVAVASNFRPAMESLQPRFESTSGHTLAISYGATGRHFAQIVNGAPFDVFLAADAERPMRLEADGIAVRGSRFTYARGRLVLWQPGASASTPFPGVLDQGEFRFIAIANPRTAPYGRAAEQVLRKLSLWERLQPRLVRGENVGQVYAFVKSGQAELGFIAASQLPWPDVPVGAWAVPPEYHDPIEQQAVLLTDSPAAASLGSFLRGDEALAVISAHGYAVAP